MPNFSIALTGLQADTVALNTIGNNLANLNTTAFKKQNVRFEDLFYQHIGTSGSADALQVGSGTRVSTTATSFAQGSLATTQNSADMAISGNGFFLLQRGNRQSLSRAGDFQTDANGNLISASGESVMGFGALNGVVQTNGKLVPLQIPVNSAESAQSTHNVSLTTSLDASAPAGTTFSSPVAVYDSLGRSHQASISFTKASPTSWSYLIKLPAGDSTGTPVNNSGTLTFDASGKLTSPSANIAGVSFPNMADGAADLTFSFNLFDQLNAPLTTQSAGASSTSSTSQDGFAAGSYESFAVDANGVLSASFSNGHSARIGQVALASVANVDGLARSGSNEYSATEASGALAIGVSNDGGLGSIEGQALEQSNVDISAEFSDLIVAQRAFEANSKTVTTFDTVTQTAISMIR